jgi:3-methyladenine DNA glycosylase AlkD
MHCYSVVSGMAASDKRKNVGYDCAVKPKLQENREMNDRTLVKQLARELMAKSDAKYRKGAERYFKEGIVLHGVRGAEIHQIIRTYYARIKDRPKEQVFALCDMLLKSGKHEELIIAFMWAHRARRKFELHDFYILEGWLKKYVSNWAACDCLCTKALGEFIFRFPEFIPKVMKWSSSNSRWMRRAAAVTLIISVRRGFHLGKVFEIAGAMLLDKDDMVQKGYGWTLKEASRRFPAEVFEFVMDHKATMPRTPLRYAIEKYPQEMRKRAMAR